MISMELRKIIIENYKKGIEVKETVRVLGISKSCVYNLIKKYKNTGSIEANYTGRQPIVTKEQTDAIEKAVIEQPDITLEELIEKLNLPIKKSQVSNILRKQGFRFKKNDTCGRTKS